MKGEDKKAMSPPDNRPMIVPGSYAPLDAETRV